MAVRQNNFNRLFIGGCGLQVGLLVTLGGLGGILLLCFLGFSVSLLNVSLAPVIGPPSVQIALEEAAFPGEMELLVREIDLLVGEIEAFQTDRAAFDQSDLISVPEAVANQDGANLYSGPGYEHSQVGFLSPGQRAEIVGRSVDPGWWLVSAAGDLFAWVSGPAVTVIDAGQTIPVVMVPSQLGQPAASNLALPLPPSPTPTATPRPMFPPGTPTPSAEAERRYVEELPVYQKVKYSLLIPPVSASISPDGSQIALTERIKLYTIGTAGAHTDIWLEDNEELGPKGNVVWSPDGQYLAFVVGFKNPNCGPCRSVALLRPADGFLSYLEAPDGLDTDAPRWTQDGRLLINVHPGEPADGTAYVYDISGHGQKAEGVYLLSASHEGQKWYPWLPGRIWRAGVSERTDSYNEG